MYEYPCQLIRVSDGNTIEANIDLGFGIKIEQKIRLFGVANTEEAKVVLSKILSRRFICRTVYNKRGKVGRVLGYVFVEDNDGNLISINDIMIDMGLAIKKTT